MTYEKTIWRNREVENPRTFNLQNNPDGTVTLIPEEGAIIEPGTPIIAANMNNIEEGIEGAHNEIFLHEDDATKHIGYTAASGTNAYTVPMPEIDSLNEGLSLKVKFTNANTGAATLNINGLGAKSIVKGNGNALSSGNIKAGQIMHLVYTDSVFQLLGEGGEYGTASAAEVLSGYTLGTENGIVKGSLALTGNAAVGDVLSGQTFYNNNAKSKLAGTLALTGDAVAANVLAGKTFYNTNAKSKLTGTIASKAAATFTPGTTNQVIAAGQYLSGAQTIAGSANLVPGNIKKGINIFGVVGTAQTVTGSIVNADAPFSITFILEQAYRSLTNTSPAETYFKITNVPGVYNVRCQLRKPSGDSSNIYYAQFYINGLPYLPGSEWTGTSWQSYHTNVSLQAGDRISIYTWCSPGTTYNTQQFQIQGTVNSSNFFL